MPEAIAWCFHSPRRLLVVGVAAITLVLGAVVAVQARYGGPDRPAGETAAGVAVPADAGAAAGAAVEFTRRWASAPAGKDVDRWRAELSALVTSELAEGLALTDPATLPGGAPAGEPVIRFASARSSALIEVPLSTGRRVLVTVVLDDGRWLASDVQPLEGNVGDVPVASPAAG